MRFCISLLVVITLPLSAFPQANPFRVPPLEIIRPVPKPNLQIVKPLRQPGPSHSVKPGFEPPPPWVIGLGVGAGILFYPWGQKKGRESELKYGYAGKNDIESLWRWQQQWGPNSPNWVPPIQATRMQDESNKGGTSDPHRNEDDGEEERELERRSAKRIIFLHGTVTKINKDGTILMRFKEVDGLELQVPIEPDEVLFWVDKLNKELFIQASVFKRTEIESKESPTHQGKWFLSSQIYHRETGQYLQTLLKMIDFLVLPDPDKGPENYSQMLTEEFPAFEKNISFQERELLAELVRKADFSPPVAALLHKLKGDLLRLRLYLLGDLLTRSEKKGGLLPLEAIQKNESEEEGEDPGDMVQATGQTKGPSDEELMQELHKWKLKPSTEDFLDDLPLQARFFFAQWVAKCEENYELKKPVPKLKELIFGTKHPEYFKAELTFKVLSLILQKKLGFTSPEFPCICGSGNRFGDCPGHGTNWRPSIRPDQP